MSRDGMSRFAKRLEAASQDLFPGVLEVDGEQYPCACSGGRTSRDFDDHGLPVVRILRTVRVMRSDLAAQPEIGARVVWTPAGKEPVEMRVHERPDRPHEEAWTIIAREV